MPGSLRVPRGVPPPPHAGGLHRALPPGAKSPGPARPADHAGPDRAPGGCVSVPTAAWRAAPVLLPDRMTARPNFRIVRDRLFGHYGLENELIDGAPAGEYVGRIRRRQRLGGLLNYYARAA